VPELGPLGSVRGALSNEWPYRDLRCAERIFILRTPRRHAWATAAIRGDPLDQLHGARALLWVWLGIDGYAITSTLAADGPSNPLLKTVMREPGQWLANYAAHHWMIAAPGFGFLGLLLALLFTMVHWRGLAFIASALGIFGIIATAGVSMFPFLMPSDIEPAASLTVWDASSSRLTLFVMLLATLIFLPIVLIYTAIAFRVLRGTVTASMVERNSANLY
jgi:cytochrome bd ubiquinol oxidase subunit II